MEEEPPSLSFRRKVHMHKLHLMSVVRIIKLDKSSTEIPSRLMLMEAIALLQNIDTTAAVQTSNPS